MNKTNRTAIKSTENAAAVLGAVAFARGIGRAPALDAEFAALEPLPIGPLSMARLVGWLRGWDAANLATVPA